MVAAMTTTTALPAHPSRRQHRSASPQEVLFDETDDLRRLVVWRFGRFTPDAHAAAALGVWEAIADGITSRHELCQAAARSVARLRRHEERQTRRLASSEWDRSDPTEVVLDRFDAELAVRRVTATVTASAAAAAWIEHKTITTPVSGARLAPKVKVAGSRWAKQARHAIGQRHEAA